MNIRKLLSSVSALVTGRPRIDWTIADHPVRFRYPRPGDALPDNLVARPAAGDEPSNEDRLEAWFRDLERHPLRNAGRVLLPSDVLAMADLMAEEDAEAVEELLHGDGVGRPLGIISNATTASSGKPAAETIRAAAAQYLATRPVEVPVRVEFGPRAWLRFMAAFEAEAAPWDVAAQRRRMIRGYVQTFRGLEVVEGRRLDADAVDVVYSDGSRRPLKEPTCD